eukprot:gnl/TRDRNA2_/TRDRNA2_84987_c0_seq1.p1 gnl/TRDRNA2_/TRDRNA2_84987_c0~~gnl/TRDRNA2_/TRDRNA2_84987_c0_seq1.p1  ORF type:complete len:799 (+),score=162.35 gnl/TRDRNA2_/TRDRNA2_84987_c0_seq1:104-2500(+)
MTSPPSGVHVQVAVRIRPFLPRERPAERQAAWVAPGNQIHLKLNITQLAAPPKIDEKVFQYDHCFSSVEQDVDGKPIVGQTEVYEAIGRQLLNNALEGFNGCLFAYGQTGSGKTYTVLGHELDPGLVPRLTQELFSAGREDGEMRVSASFLEIYNEQLKDLLNPELKRRNPLYVHQHPQLGVYVPHLTEAPVGSHSECMELLDFGSKIRATSQTNMNSTSSRSHALFILRIALPFQEEGKAQRIRSSTLNLIDLAGSERVKKSGAAGQRMREGQNINSSLSVLGQVISKLAEGKGKHVPFRQSKLTYLLTDALNGNSKTLMVAAISPASGETEETLGTLRFASSVKKVRTTVTRNEQEVYESDLMLQTMRSEVEELRAAASNACPQSPQAERLRQSAEAVEQAVLSMQTRLDPSRWGEARRAQAEADKARREALSALSLPFAIGGILAATEEGVSANSPYLLNISDDISLTGRLIYFLPEGPPCTVGSEDSNRIHLIGLGIADRLCDLSVNPGGLGVEVQHAGRGGRLLVDGTLLDSGQSRTLWHGCRLVFGRAFAFRLVIPLAAPRDAAQQELCGEVFAPGADPRPCTAAAIGGAGGGSPFAAVTGGVEDRIRMLLETTAVSRLGEGESGELLRRAVDLQNDIDEAVDLLREIGQPSRMWEVGLLMRPGADGSGVQPSSQGDTAGQSAAASTGPRVLPQPQLVINLCRQDGELIEVWTVPRFQRELDMLRDKYQSRVDRQREGLPVDEELGISVAWGQDDENGSLSGLSDADPARGGAEDPTENDVVRIAGMPGEDM